MVPVIAGLDAFLGKMQQARFGAVRGGIAIHGRAVVTT